MKWNTGYYTRYKVVEWSNDYGESGIMRWDEIKWYEIENDRMKCNADRVNNRKRGMCNNEIKWNDKIMRSQLYLSFFRSH